MSDKIDRLDAISGGVSRETAQRMIAFERLFLSWAQSINLVAGSTLDDLWERHILDSAQLVPLAGDARCWVDLGSGGGFPGVVVAILRHCEPAARTIMVESNQKKGAFLRTCVAQLQLRAEVVVARIEKASLPDDVDIVSARALAPLDKLLGLAAPLLRPGGATAFFQKGRGFREEIASAKLAWRFNLIDHPSRIDPDSRILEINNLREYRPDEEDRHE